MKKVKIIETGEIGELLEVNDNNGCAIVRFEDGVINHYFNDDDDEYEIIDDEEVVHEVDSNIEKIVVEKETVSEISNNPILIDYKTYLGCGIDKTEFIRSLNVATAANKGREVIGLEPFPLDFRGNLLATVAFWNEVYDLVVEQTDRSKSNKKVGF